MNAYNHYFSGNAASDENKNDNDNSKNLDIVK